MSIEIASASPTTWRSMKRGVLFGITSFLVFGAITELATHGIGLVSLLLLAISAGVVPMARKSPPSRSRKHAVIGWLIGFFCPYAVLGIITVAVVLISGSN